MTFNSDFHVAAKQIRDDQCTRVVDVEPEGKDSGRGRIFLRIGIGESSWVGSFERGHRSVSTIFTMPDGKHLFVSAEGAGYITDAKSRTLVEEIGTEVVGVMRDEPHDADRRQSRRPAPGSVRQDRPALENGRHRFRRIPAHGNHEPRAGVKFDSRVGAECGSKPPHSNVS